MKQLTDSFMRAAFVVCAACYAFSAVAQGLWKYTDKDGKVTYSDKAPKDGEKAEPVIADTTGTVVPASRNTRAGSPQGSASGKSLASEREAMRDNYRKKVDAARGELEQARNALEQGREPTSEEREIIVGRGKDGKPLGMNAINRKPEYYDRINELEAVIKKAEEKVTTAERDFQEKAPK